MSSFFLIPYISEMTWHLPSSLWLLSLSIIPSKPTHVVKSVAKPDYWKAQHLESQKRRLMIQGRPLPRGEVGDLAQPEALGGARTWVSELGAGSPPDDLPTGTCSAQRKVLSKTSKTTSVHSVFLSRTQNSSRQGYWNGSSGDTTTNSNCWSLCDSSLWKNLHNEKNTPPIHCDHRWVGGWWVLPFFLVYLHFWVFWKKHVSLLEERAKQKLTMKMSWLK